ncbi:MAG: aldehyde dehydrogenase family protein [Angelakisella sp.]
MNAQQIAESQHAFFDSNSTKPLTFRKQMLRKLKSVILAAQPELYAALYADLGKSESEAYLTEISIVIGEIDAALRHLDRWAKPQRVVTPLSHFPATSRIYSEPYGVVLVLSPWNYPFQLALAPVAGAMAAGNCVMLKCSKSSKATSTLLRRLIHDNFDSRYLCCVDESCSYDDILGQRYDYIFFTGSERVGKIVMESASRHLTPVSLELGGKSPCLVDSTADLALSARRIAWGKLLNAGQTCVAPDYLLVDRRVCARFTELLVQELQRQQPDPLHNPDYPNIISPDHFARLCGLIDRHPDRRWNGSDPGVQKISPAILQNCTFDSEIMREEIFGPILPILPYDDITPVIAELKRRPKPLACYIFSGDKAFVSRLLGELSFGGGCVNDVVMHLANHHLPFGGVGSSGMGGYHAKYSFATFSHQKSILRSSRLVDIPLRYAPFTDKKLRLIRTILK